MKVLTVERKQVYKVEIFPTEHLTEKEILKNVEYELNQRTINMFSEGKGFNLIEKDFKIKKQK